MLNSREQEIADVTLNGTRDCLCYRVGNNGVQVIALLGTRDNSVILQGTRGCWGLTVGNMQLQV